MTPKHHIQVITRAANILRCLEDEANGLTLSQIAERVGLARSTVQRIVDALREEQLLIAASPTSGVMMRDLAMRLVAIRDSCACTAPSNVARLRRNC